MHARFVAEAERRKSCRLGCRIVVLCLIATQLSRGADTTSNELWPESDVYVALNQRVRLVFTAKRERDVDFKNLELGADVELSLRQFRLFLIGRLLEQDSTRAKRFTMRLGYHYKRSLSTDPPVNESRPVAEFTHRWVFPGEILMSNRVRGEFRFVSQDFSFRLRDQLKFEKDFEIHGYAITADASGEAFYDASPGKWDRFRFTGGFVFPIGIRLAIEPYYMRQIATRSQPRNLNVVGIALQVHFPK